MLEDAIRDTQYLRNGKEVQLPSAVPQLFDRSPYYIQHGCVQIRYQRALRIADVTPAFDLARSPARQQDRQVIVPMHVAIAQTAAVGDD